MKNILALFIIFVLCVSFSLFSFYFFIERNEKTCKYVLIIPKVMRIPRGSDYGAPLDEYACLEM